ncbi:MAG: hypothetical protein ABFC34_09100 [Methanobacterium sp.]
MPVETREISVTGKEDCGIVTGKEDCGIVDIAEMIPKKSENQK